MLLGIAVVALQGRFHCGARTGGTNLIEGVIEMTLGLFAAFPTAIIGAMMFLVGIGLTKFVRDVRPGKDLIPLVLTIAVSLLANMVVGFLAGLAVHYGMGKWWGKSS
jgi:MFS superfamily sulfate permease-like transporter